MIFSIPGAEACAHPRALLAGCFALSLLAQPAPASQVVPPAPAPQHATPSPASARSPRAHKAPAPSSTTPLRPTESARPVPANSVATLPRVTLLAGIIHVEANNADLSQILLDIASLSGLTLKGLNGGPRIFGNFGPATLPAVLHELLVGTGYDYILIGGADKGLPRELVLSRASPPSSAARAPATDSAALPGTPMGTPVQDNQLPSDLQQIPAAAASPEPQGPGAVPAAPSQDDLENNLRMQQRLQRLEQEQQPQQTPPQ